MVSRVLATASFYWEKLKDPLTEGNNPIAVANESATKIMGRHMMITFPLAAGFKLAERFVVRPLFKTVFSTCFEAALISGVTGLAMRGFYYRYPQDPRRQPYLIGNSDFIFYCMDALFCCATITVNALAVKKMQNHPRAFLSKLLKATQPTLSIYLVVALRGFDPILPLVPLLFIQGTKKIFSEFASEIFGKRSMVPPTIRQILTYTTPLAMGIDRCRYLFRGCHLDPNPYIISMISALAFKQFETHPVICEKASRLVVPASSVFLTSSILLVLRHSQFISAFRRLNDNPRPLEKG